MYPRTALALTAMIATGLGVLPATPAGAAAPAGVRVPLLHQPGSNCERGADALPGTGTAARSAVVVRPTGGDTVHAEVQLRDAVRDATYLVYLIQSDGDLVGTPMDCYVLDATVRTNHRGDATFRLAQPRLPGAVYFHVYLYAWTDTVDRFDTRLIPLPG